MTASSARLQPITQRKMSPSPPARHAAVPMAKFCGETTLPNTSPELLAAAISTGSMPAARAARSWSAPNGAFDGVSGPVTATPSQPIAGATSA